LNDSISTHYGNETLEIHDPINVLGDLQRTLRISRIPLLPLALPSATLLYYARFAVPANGPLIAAGVAASEGGNSCGLNGEDG
jgi:hypothetical protein